MKVKTFFLYNTVCSVTIYDEREDAEQIIDEVKQIAYRIRRVLDFYDPDSELGTLNRTYRARVPMPVSEELCRFLMCLLEFSEKSGYCFDPTLGAAVNTWNIPAHVPDVPNPKEIEAAMERTGGRYVSCDMENRTVTFEKDGIQLDAGGAGKGYAVECAVRHLKKRGVQSASVNFGGNLYVIGKKKQGDEEGRRWRIGIQSPWKSYAKSIGTLELENCGIATSGGYDRFFIKEEKVYHHLLDPHTGYPVENTIDSVTIVSESAFDADLLSTACFVAGIETAEQLCRNMEKPADYIFVKKDGTLIVSDRIREQFHAETGKREKQNE